MISKLNSKRTLNFIRKKLVKNFLNYRNSITLISCIQ